MGLFSKNANPATISATELQERLAERQNKNKFLDKLADKGTEKPFSEENKSIYQLSNVLIWVVCGFFVATAWLNVYDHVKGYFAFMDFLAPTVAACLSILFLGAIEWARYHNAAVFFWRFFFRDKIDVLLLAKGFGFTVITAAFAWFGAPKTISMLVPSPTRAAVEMESTEAITATFLPQIKAAEAAAADFKSSRSWMKKLDAPDGKRYSQLQNQAATLRLEMAEAIKRVDARNAQKNIEAAAAFQQSIAAAEAATLTATRTVILAIIFAEILFWCCFWYKENYEWMAYNEAEFSGHLKPTGGGGGGKKANQQIGLSVLQNSQNGNVSNTNAALLNEMRPPVIQTGQTVLETLDTNLNHIATYWARSIQANLEGKPDQHVKNFQSAFERAGHLQDKHQFAFKSIGEVLFVLDPRPKAKRQDNRRDGKTVMVLLPPSEFYDEVAHAEAIFKRDQLALADAA